MAAYLPASNDLAPTEFSPSPGLVRLAVIVLAVAGLAGLWKGAVTGYREAGPPPVANPTPGVTEAVPAVAATADTLIPPQAAEPLEPLPAASRPAARPAREPAAEPAESVAAPSAPLVVEATPAPAAPAAEPPLAETEDPDGPPPEEEIMPD